MKRRLAVSAGIFSFLAVLVFGYLRQATERDATRERAEAVSALVQPSANLPVPEQDKINADRALSEREQKAADDARLSAQKAAEEEKLLAEQPTADQPKVDQPAETTVLPAPEVAATQEAPKPPSAPKQADKSQSSRSSGSSRSTRTSQSTRSAPVAPTAPLPTASATAASSLEEVDALLRKLDWGQMAFNVPEKLLLEQTALIHLLLSPAQTAEQLTDVIREHTTESVKIESARIRISGMMEAKLVGSAFDIRSITPEEPQMVSRTEPTEWKWEIRPRQPGRQSLHLTLNAIVRFEDRERPRVVRTFDRVIQVDVAAKSNRARLLLPGATLAAALVALGLGTVLYRWWQKRKGAAFVRSIAPTVAAGEEPAVDLFLSYSRRDEKRVLPIADRLRAAGLSVWFDQGSIDGATLWAQEISDAIRRAKVCVLFGSISSFGSAHVIREMSLACEERKPILPLQLDPVETPSAMRYQLAGIQHIILYQGDAEANFQLILRALKRLGAEPAKAAVRDTSLPASP